MLKDASSPRYESGQPIVVTGGAGYIGSFVVRMLLEAGRSVRVVDRFLYGDAALDEVRAHPNLEIQQGDFRNESTIVTAVADASSVIHLGAIVGDPACAIDEDLAISTNLTATEQLAAVCADFAIPRLIFASTCSVYGANHEPITEESPLNPVSLYASTKISAEQAILNHRTSHFEPVILRLGNAYVASPRPRFDLVINLLTAKAIQDGVITIHGGDQWRPFIHAFDLARSMLMALDAPSSLVGGQIINVGVDSENYQLGEIGRIIQNAVPTARVETNANIIDRRNYYVKFSKARQLLGFSPARNVKHGIHELADIVACGMVGDYRESRYQNVLALSQEFAQSPSRMV